MKRITFDIKVAVPMEQWRIMQKEGFKENELPSMIVDMIHDISECIAGRALQGVR